MHELCQLSQLCDFETIEIKQFSSADRDRPDFHNKYLKMLYFIRWEGILSTFRKYFAHKYNQQRFLTILTIKHKNTLYLNISVQSETKADEFVLMNEFFRCSQNHVNMEDIENNLEKYIDSFNQYNEISGYDLLNIDTTKSISLKKIQTKSFPKYKNGLFIYGLGGYVKMFIIHHFKKVRKLACIDYKAWVSIDFKNKYGFLYSFNIPENSFDLLKSTQLPIVIIATYHSDHAVLASKIFNANNNSIIFIEKPPTVNLDDLRLLIDIYNNGGKLEIGFNRRFIDFSKYVKEKVSNKTVVITCSVKEVLINSNHWYLWENQGTRITGNAVHWFDLANWWIKSIPIELNLLSSPLDSETSAISVLYKNGSILNLTLSDKGNSMRGVQENIEIRFDNETIFIYDFIKLTHIKDNGFKYTKYKLFRDKGHNRMYQNFTKVIKNNAKSDYSVFDLVKTSVVTFYASSMLINKIRNTRIEEDINKFLEQARISTE